MTRAYERLLRYAAIDTGSDETSAVTPSSPGQTVLAEKLAEELRELGVSDVYVDEHAYVYGRIPATAGYESRCRVGFIAHLDTSTDACHGAAKPQVIENYDGGSIPLGSSGLKLTPESFPHLTTLKGKTLITTDGTTVLGADDKAGVAEIMTMCQRILTGDMPHGTVCVCFTPDEEIGRGADHFDRAKFPAPVAYTVDGGELGEIEYENFNAAAAELTVRGLNIHPGEAKNKMKNAVLMANQFLSLLPPAQTPAHTEGYEGFYHVCAMEGDESLARVQLIVRDHDRKKFETRKDFLRRTADYLNTVWGVGSFELTVRDSYYNMKEKILPHMDLIENAQAAMRAADVAPRIVAIRGGTDGARLSWEGLPCPNLSTGGLNFHSIHEYIPVESLQKMTRVLVALARA